MEDKTLPMQYYSAYNTIIKYLPKDFLLVGEGANTMYLINYYIYNII